MKIIKKIMVFLIIAVFMTTNFLPVIALAAPPTSPGLWIEVAEPETGVKFATNPNVSGYHTPTNPSYAANNATLVSNLNNKTVTVNVPSNATYVMFRYWDYGNPSGTGWITGGTVTRRINGVSVDSGVAGGNGIDDYKNSGGLRVANKWYFAYSADSFAKVDGTDTFTVDAVRRVNGITYRYTITYNINWINPSN